MSYLSDLPQMEAELKQRLTRDLAEYRAQLAEVTARIERLDRPVAGDASLDAVADSFGPMGRVGGSGRHGQALNRRREQSLTRHMDRARTLAPLYRQQVSLERVIASYESGARERRMRADMAAAARVRAAKVGDRVFDTAYGEATVIRVNKKTLTIRTPSGYTEVRPFHLVADVLAPVGERMVAHDGND